MGYLVKVIERDGAGLITSAELVGHVEGQVTFPQSNGFQFLHVPKGFLVNPKLVITDGVAEVVNDDDLDTNDGLHDTMETNIREFASLKMGVDDDSNLVSSRRDNVKLLNGLIFLTRMADGNEYKSDGLLAHVTTSGFTQGDALNTANKVTSFYSEVLRELHDNVIAERDTFLDNRL